MERRRIKSPTASTLTRLLMLFASVALASSADYRADYSGWRVLEVVLEDEDVGSATLQGLQDMERPSYLEILKTRRDKGTAEVAVSPRALEVLRDRQQHNEISFSEIIPDLGKKLESGMLTLRSGALPNGEATYDRYMDVDEIIAHLEELPNQFPDRVSLRKVGDSVEKRPIYLVTVTSGASRNVDKPVVFIDGGIHAREWISPASALNIIGQLIESPSLIKHIEWQIIPLLNPDGYAYSWSNDRLWRKNRGNSDWACTGTDLNRNFGFHWGETGSSSNPCSSIYKGSTAFSEPETRALRDTMTAIKDRIEVYVTIHSYGQYILYPWGYTTHKERYNDAQLHSAGEGMARVIKKNDGTVFQVGTAAKLLYPASGASDDWAAGELKIPLVYTLELRDEGAGGFILPEYLIKPAINDAWLSMKYLARQLLRKTGQRLEVDTSVAPAEHRTPSTTAEATTTTTTTTTTTERIVATPRAVETRTYNQPIRSWPAAIRQPSRTPANRRRYYYDSSEEDSSSEESSEEDSDEDRK